MTQRSKPKVVVTRKLPDAIETRMMELFDTSLNHDDVPLTAKQLKAAMAEAEIVVPTVTDRIDADIIAAAGPRLRLIASFGTGVDHIDLEAARARKILVSNTPGVLTEDTADMVMGLIVSTARRLAEGERLVRAGQWRGWGPTLMLGTRLWGKRLGIIGMGRIGQAVARRARAFGMSIHYHNRKRVHPDIEAELDATWWESLDQLLARMDIVSVNCPSTPATYHLLSARRLRLMPRHGILINTSRGSAIDETVLVDMLAEGKLGGAGFDVYEHGTTIDPRLLAMENVVLLPHIGSATVEGRVAMGERVIINIQTVINGHKPPDWVLEAFD